MKLIQETRKKLQDNVISEVTGIPYDTVVSHTTGRRKKRNKELEKYFLDVIDDARKQIDL